MPVLPVHIEFVQLHDEIEAAADVSNAIQSRANVRALPTRVAAAVGALIVIVGCTYLASTLLGNRHAYFATADSPGPDTVPAPETLEIAESTDAR